MKAIRIHSLGGPEVLQLEDVPEPEPKEGDAVVTSGLGGAFPRNLAVGHITRIIPGAVGLYQDVEVTPDVDFGRLGLLGRRDDR